MKYVNVETPEEHKEFLQQLGGSIKRDEQGFYHVFPSDRLGWGNNVIPVCKNGAWMINKQEDMGKLMIAASAAFRVAIFLNTEKE